MCKRYNLKKPSPQISWKGLNKKFSWLHLLMEAASRAACGNLYLWMSYQGLSGGDPQPRGGATDAGNSRPPFLPYGPRILGNQSRALRAITFPWAGFCQTAAYREVTQHRTTWGRAPSPAASTRLPPHPAFLGGPAATPPDSQAWGLGGSRLCLSQASLLCSSG